MEAPQELCPFVASEVAREAWAIARSNWKLFLGWAVVPVVISYVVEMLGTEAFRLRNTEDLGILVLMGASWALALVNAWLMAPYRVRVYRFVAIGESPSMFYGLQLWDERTWRLIWKTFLVNVQLLLIELVTIAIPSVIAAVVLRNNEIGVDTAVYQYVMYGCISAVGWYVAAYIFTQRITLTYPGVALGEKYTIAQYGVFGGPAKSCMARTMVYIWAPAAILGHFGGFGNFFIWDASPWVMRLVAFVNNAVWIYTGMASLAAGALIYGKLSPGFPEKAAEYERIRQEIREIGAWKAKGASEDSRPASHADSPRDQSK